MDKFNLLRLIMIIFLVFPNLNFIPPQIERPQLQNLPLDYPRFLITPYYRIEMINSFFDHELPGYTNQHLLLYTGEERPNEDPDTCTPTWNCYDGHNGYDFDMEYEQVIASADGYVNIAGWYPGSHSNGYGLYIRIAHNINGIQYQTYYGHLTTLAVQAGETVRAGDIIGTSGSTGHSSGPHLHFEVRIYDNGDWKYIDPFGWQGLPDPDPWEQYPTGHASWCMWRDGEWANLCDSSIPYRSIPAPNSGEEFIIDSLSDEGGAFSKGYGGFGYNQCVGVEGNGCLRWYQSWIGYNGHTYRGIADGFETIDIWARWSMSILPSYKSYYEVFVYTPDTYLGTDTFTWNARYVVHGADGINYTATVDEHKENGENYYPYNRWLSIGIYSLKNDSYIYTSDATSEAAYGHCPAGPSGLCRFTVDAIRLVSLEKYYFPTIETSSGWYPKIQVLNTSGGKNVVRVNYFGVNGNYITGQVLNINFNSIGTFTPASGTRTAIVTSDQKISLVLYNDKTGDIIDAYTGIPSVRIPKDPTDPYSPANWVYASSNIYVPAFYNSYYGWSSTLYLQNPGKLSAYVDIVFYNTNGTTAYTISNYLILPYAQAQISYIGVWFSSVRISERFNQSLAVVVKHYHSTYHMSCSYEGISNESTTKGFIPALFKNYSNWMSSYEVQEISGQSVNLRVRYYPSMAEKPIQLDGMGHQEIYMGNEVPSGRSSAVVNYESGNGQFIVSVHHTNTYVNAGLANYGFNIGNRDLYVPYIIKGSGWSISLNIQNLDQSELADLKVIFYNSDGTYRTTVPVDNLPPRYTYEMLAAIPSNFVGSAWIHSENADLAVAIHQAHTDGRHYGYTVP